jgi:undecaprenyl-diphosphatase
MINLKQADKKLLDLLNKHLHNRVTDRFALIITRLGDFGAIWIAIALFLFKMKAYRTIGDMIILSLVLNTLLCEGIIKHIFRRKRPYSPLRKFLVVKPTTYSFPSGHTSSSFAVVGVFYNSTLSIYLPYILVLAILISFSRLYLYVHYPSDVLIGVILGLICSNMVSYFML